MATTTQSTMLPQWYQDYLATAANRGLNLANMPFQPYGGQMVAPLSQTQNAGINMIQQRATSGSPLMRSAQQQMQDTIGGKYLQNNPYLDAVLNRSLGDVQARLGQLGVGSGSFGNSGVAAIQAREMADSANQIRYQRRPNTRSRRPTTSSRRSTTGSSSGRSPFPRGPRRTRSRRPSGTASSR